MTENHNEFASCLLRRDWVQRFLPATKAQPKEMLPVVDKPLIQYVVEECVASGIEHIIIVTGRGKNAIEDHFDSSPELESFLESKGKSDLAKLVRRHREHGAIQLHAAERAARARTRRTRGKGFGGQRTVCSAAGRCDYSRPRPATRQLVEVYEATGKGAITVEEVPRERTRLYGIVDVEPANVSRWGERLKKIRDLVEKPSAAEAPFQPGPLPGGTFCHRKFSIVWKDQAPAGGKFN